MTCPRASRLILATCIVPLTIVAGCGSSSSGGSSESSNNSSKSASEILESASKAAKSAKTVRLTGTVAQTGGKKVEIDAHAETSGAISGTFTIEGKKVEIIEVDKALYIKGAAALFGDFGGSSSAASELAGKWLEIPLESSLTSSFKNLTGLQSHFKEELNNAKKSGSLTKTGTKTFSGVEATGVRSSKDPTVTIYVSNAEPAYPVAIVTSGAAPGTILLTEWNTPVSISAPSGAIELSKLIPGA